MIKKLSNWLNFERRVQLLVLLSLFDGLATHLALHFKFARELNPILIWAFDVGPGLFWVVKMGLVFSGLVIITWAVNHKPSSEDFAKSVVTKGIYVYLLVMITHFVGWSEWLFAR